MYTHHKTYEPYVSPLDPCMPMKTKMYSTPPQLYLGYQPPNLPQFTPAEALKAGTLWKAFYDTHYGPSEKPREGDPT